MTYRHMSRRKPVYGIGVNDAEYAVGNCPFYRRWHNMMKRCYDAGYQAKQPTYKDCTVCHEWLTFSKFKDWMLAQDWEGKELDKDILVCGNKVYSPDNCVFVSRQINSLIHERKYRNNIPQGVWFDLGAGKWRAEFTALGKKRYIGVFSSVGKAASAYRDAKAKHVRRIAKSQPQPIRDGLMRHADALSC